jgi:hypothetical protein
MSQVVQIDPAGRVRIFPFLFRVGDTVSFKSQNLAGWLPKGIIVPGTLTGTTVSFQTCLPNKAGNDVNQQYFDVRDEAGTIVALSAVSNQYRAFTAAQQAFLMGILWAKLVASGAQSGQEIEVYLVCSALP